MFKKDDLEKRLDELEQRVTILEDNNIQKPLNHSVSELPKIIIKNIDKIPTKTLVILSLKISPSQSIMQLELSLQKIGWVKDTFFTKNFATTLISKGVAQPDGKDSKNKNTYSLSDKGHILAEELEKTLQKKFS